MCSYYSISFGITVDDELDLTCTELLYDLCGEDDDGLTDVESE